MVSEQTPVTTEPELESGDAAPVIKAEEPAEDGAPVVEDVKEGDGDEDEEEEEDDDDEDDEDEDGNPSPHPSAFPTLFYLLSVTPCDGVGSSCNVQAPQNDLLLCTVVWLGFLTSHIGTEWSCNVGLVVGT